MAQPDTETNGLRYAPGIKGKGKFRIREALLRDRYGPLVRRNAVDAVKLDLVLRGLGLLPQHLGGRQVRPGYVLNRYTYEAIHDLVRDPTHYTGTRVPGPVEERRDVTLKREFVRQQLEVLEREGLVYRDKAHTTPTGRPFLYVLRDDGSGEPLDDPAGSNEDKYITVLGHLISSAVLARWAAPELVAYMCAMTAEWRDPGNRLIEHGQGTWWRSPRWFVDPHYRRGDEVVLTFTEKTIKRGLARFVEDGWMTSTSIRRHPTKNTRLKGGRRNSYTNHFAEKARTTDAISPETFSETTFADELATDAEQELSAEPAD